MSELTEIKLGGRTFPLAPLPWGRLKLVLSAINRIGAAVAAGVFDDRTTDDMGAVISLAFGITPEEFEQMPTDIEQVAAAFNAVVQISGLERSMEKALGEARRAGRLGPPAQ